MSFNTLNLFFFVACPLRLKTRTSSQVGIDFGMEHCPVG